MNDLKRKGTKTLADEKSVSPGLTSDEVDDVLLTLAIIISNDKTEYTYGGKLSHKRSGAEPGSGERYKTPRELARELIGEIGNSRRSAETG